MSNASETTHCLPISAHGNHEGLPPAQENKPLLSRVSLLFLSLVRRHPFLSSIVISVILTGIVAGVANQSYTPDKRYPPLRIPLNEDGIILVGYGAGFDETNKNLEITWEILGCGAYRLPTYPLPAAGILKADEGCGSLDRAVDIYLNCQLGPFYSYDPASLPWTPTGERQYLDTLVGFSTFHLIDYLDANMAPFDAYPFNVSVFAIEKATNEPVPILALTAGQTPDNLYVSSVEAETTSNYTYDSETGPTTINIHSKIAHIKLKRTRFAQALTMCLFLINWALTVGSIYIVFAIFRREGTDDAVLLLPITIILTIPILRSLYPGSLPFGIFIDTFGFVLQMMTVAVCSITLVYSIATPNSVPKRQASCDSGNIREMSNALHTTPYPPVSTHGNHEGLPPAQENKPLLSRVFLLFLSPVRRHPLLSSIVISMILAGIVAGVANKSYTSDKQDPSLRIPQNEDGVAFVGYTANLDETSQQLAITWEILGCGAYRLPTYPPSTKMLGAGVGCGPLDRAVDIYFDREPNPLPYDPTKLSWTLVDIKQYARGLDVIFVHHDIKYLDTYVAPFDAYSFSALVFVIEKETNQSIPIVTLTAGQASEKNFDVSSVGVKTMNSYTYDSEMGPTTTNVDSGIVYIEAKRSRFAQTLTICLFLINWTLAACSIYIVILVAFRRERTNDAVLLLPVTIILTIPTLRGLYPCSPPFTMFIDIFGFFLQMMIVAVCSIILVYLVVIPKSVLKR